MRVMEIFQEGGVSMYWILVVGLVGLAMAVVHAVIARRWSLITTVILLALVVGIAGLGMMDGRHKAENGAIGLEHEPQLKARMLAQGYEEAMRPVQFAGILVLFAGALVTVGEVRKRRRQPGDRGQDVPAKGTAAVLGVLVLIVGGGFWLLRDRQRGPDLDDATYQQLMKQEVAKAFAPAKAARDGATD